MLVRRTQYIQVPIIYKLLHKKYSRCAQQYRAIFQRKNGMHATFVRIRVSTRFRKHFLNTKVKSFRGPREVFISLSIFKGYSVDWLSIVNVLPKLAACRFKSWRAISLDTLSVGELSRAAEWSMAATYI